MGKKAADDLSRKKAAEAPPNPFGQNKIAIILPACLFALTLVLIIGFIALQPDEQPEFFPSIEPAPTDIQPDNIPSIEPTPTPITLHCGNYVCQSDEDCASCPVDCGDCPTPTPTPAVVPYSPDVMLVVNYSRKLQGLATANGWCDYKINPDIPIKTQANAIIPKTSSSSFNYLDNSIAIYKWIKENIQYELGASSYSSQTDIETLTVRGGKCDEQARLFASLVLSVGGIARTLTITECSHAFAEVFFPITNESEKLVIFQKLRQEFNLSDSVLYSSNDSDENIRGIWIPFDTAGTTSPGQYIEECRLSYIKGNIQFFCPNPCADLQPNLYYYVEKNNCWSACPAGSRIYRGAPYICHACPSDHPFSYSGDPYACHSCPSSSPWYYHGLCYANCPPGTRGASDYFCG